MVASAVERHRGDVPSARPGDPRLVRATGEWRGRAGGYAIQGRGAALVADPRATTSTSSGCPLARLLELRPELLADRPDLQGLPRSGRSRRLPARRA